MSPALMTGAKYIATGLILGGILTLGMALWTDRSVPQSTGAVPPIQAIDPAAGGRAPVLPALPQEEVAVSAVRPEVQGELFSSDAHVLPALEVSDVWLRIELDKLGVDTSLLERLAQDRIAEQAVVHLTAMAEGQLVRKRLPPINAFEVRKEGGELWLDPGGHHRFDRYVDLLNLVDAAALAAFVRTIEPLLDQALSNLGDRRRTRMLLQTASHRLLAAPVVEQPIRLVRPGVYYQFRQARFEALPDLHKQLLRMGPRHTRRIQRYVREFMAAYG